MKNIVKIIGIIACFSLTSAVFNACKTGEGCQLEDKYQAKTDKQGNLSKKRGNSNLFSKKDRKKLRSNKG